MLEKTMRPVGVVQTAAPPTRHRALIEWVEAVAALSRPADVRWCDGSQAEWDELTVQLVAAGTLIRLNPEKRPNSFYARSDPRDVARVESRTFICSDREEDAGPTNNWRDPVATRQTLSELFRGCMEGRTMYVVPFCMGPIGSDKSVIGVEITDSPYVVLSMRIMVRMGHAGARRCWARMASSCSCVHSVGACRWMLDGHGRRSLAVQRREVDRTLSGGRVKSGAYRLRLRRQRAAWQEVLGTCASPR